MRTQTGSRSKPFQRVMAALSVIAILSLWIAPPARSQELSPTPSNNKADLHQALLDLTNQWTVMCVAAHPDDEDGTTLTVLRRKHGAHTVSLFTTYGEGGQNAIGPELYEELGVIRLRETLKASEIQGSEPYFLGLKDFGFSKSMEETFKVWGHDEALRRMVLNIRELRPDVIITNHDTSRGHGHHQATGLLIIEAFDAAADPKRYPEQLKGLKPWQVQRLFVRVFSGGSPDTKSAAADKIVYIEPNEVDPTRGTSFAEQALQALQEHATQGPWPKTIEDLLKARRIQDGKLPPIRYRLVREAPNAPPLPSVVLYVGGSIPPPAFVAGLTSPTMAEAALTKFLDQPNLILEGLIQLRIRKDQDEVPSENPVRGPIRHARLEKALALAAGVSLSIRANEHVLIPGRKTTFTINLTNAGSKPLQISKLLFRGLGKELPVSTPDHLLSDTDTSVRIDVTTPATTPYTVPKAEHLYDGQVFGLPFTASALIDIEGAQFLVKSQLNLDVAPAVEIKNVSPSPYLWTPATINHPLSFQVTLKNNLSTPFDGGLVFTNSPGPGAEVGPKLALAPNETRELSIKSNIIPVDTPRERRTPRPDFGVVFLEVKRTGSTTPLTQRAVRVRYVDARTAPDLRVGYVSSVDQTLQRSLAALGVEAKALNMEDIQNADLAAYHTIIIDNRGYEAQPGLVESNARLLEYVEKGGTLVVFYHKDNEWNPDASKERPQLAPYSIILGSERVTDETAPIGFLEPRHLLLNYPNRITQADFQNWIQERGLYYPRVWDPAHYTPLFSSNDPGAPPLRGGFLVARHGQGNYIYTSMVWYRQLRAGVSGAYRMLANIISYGKARTRPPQRRRRSTVRPLPQPLPSP